MAFHRCNLIIWTSLRILCLMVVFDRGKATSCGNTPEPHSNSSQPNVKIVSNGSSAWSGGSVSLGCNVAGSPEPCVVWVKPNLDVISSDNASGRFEVDADDVLTITDLRQSDAGTYKCKATNAAGTGEAEITVEVSSLAILLGVIFGFIACILLSVLVAVWKYRRNKKRMSIVPEEEKKKRQLRRQTMANGFSEAHEKENGGPNRPTHSGNRTGLRGCTMAGHASTQTPVILTLLLMVVLVTGQEVTVQAGAAQNCSSEAQFQCEDALLCIDVEKVCNMQADCTDLSDERHCEFLTCPPYFDADLKTNVTLEINSTDACNGYYDCPNREDEEKAVCVSRTGNGVLDDQDAVSVHRIRRAPVRPKQQTTVHVASTQLAVRELAPLTAQRKKRPQS
ncbi:hypothetical protein Bbelb_258930 [Branchiostoma belcheri]|nr:hypothetical protein Bbelb_258930 [Branchiostoma belcheri]